MFIDNIFVFHQNIWSACSGSSSIDPFKGYIQALASRDWGYRKIKVWFITEKVSSNLTDDVFIDVYIWNKSFLNLFLIYLGLSTDEKPHISCLWASVLHHQGQMETFICYTSGSQTFSVRPPFWRKSRAPPTQRVTKWAKLTFIKIHQYEREHSFQKN